MKSKKGPPRYAQRLLQFFLKEEITEEVLGDLEEKYERLSINKSPTNARINYWYASMSNAVKSLKSE